MNGQGCPINAPLPERALRIRVRLLTAALKRIAWTVVFLLGIQIPAASAQTPAVNRVRVESTEEAAIAASTSLPSLRREDPSLQLQHDVIRIRLTWGGGEQRTWVGRVRATGGQLMNVQPLSLDRDAAAATLLVGNELDIEHWQATEFGGADVDLRVGSETRLVVEMTSREHPDRVVIQSVAINQQGATDWEIPLDDAGNRVAVTRPSNDLIPVSFERPHLVFETGESFKFSFAPHRTGLDASFAVATVRLLDGNAAVPILQQQNLEFSLDSLGSSAPQDIAMPLPKQEGVYTVELSLEPKRIVRISDDSDLRLTRRVQLVVLGKSAPNRPGPSAVSGRTETIEAAELVSRQRLLGWPGAKPKLLSNDRFEVVRDPDDSTRRRDVIELEPDGWVAIPLSLSSVTNQTPTAKRIRIEYFGGADTSLGVSLLESDPQGQVDSRGADSGSVLPINQVGESQNIQWSSHDLLVWPSESSGHLLLVNRSKKQKICIGTIQLEPVASADLPAKHRANAAPFGQRRGAYLFLTEPGFAAALGVKGAYEAELGQPLDDWNTFYLATARLIEYLKLRRMQGVYLNVACDGSGIYPSEHNPASPRHDSGIFFSDGRDPVRKDVVELMYRMFEREGLKLIPVLNWNAPLAALEHQRVEGKSGSGFDLVDFNQSPMTKSFQDYLPVYNPLDPAVDHQVQEMLQEFLDRYGDRPGFEGVAISLQPDAVSLLPGLTWGYDPTTIQRFLQAHPDVELPGPWVERRDQLLSVYRDVWIQWRASQMSQRYSELADRVAAAKASARLLLAPVDLHQNETLSAALTPSLHRKLEYEASMRQVGLLRDRLVDAHPNLLVMSPHRLAPDRELAVERVAYAVEHSSQVAQWYQGAQTVELFCHQDDWVQFDQLQALPEFSEQAGSLLRQQPMRLAGPAARERFVRSIRDHDAVEWVDGATRLSNGTDSKLNDLFNVFSQLPRHRFVDVKHPYGEKAILPVAVRTLSSPDGDYFYLANASPRPATVQLSCQSSEPFSAEMFSSQAVQFSAVTGQPDSFGRIEVPPYSLAAGRLPPGKNLLRYELELDDPLGRALRKQLLSLQTKLAQARSAEPIEGLENGQFVGTSGETLRGWTFGTQEEASFDVRNAEQASQPSSQYLRISNRGDRAAWIRSNLVDLPTTGRLSISAWIRTEPDTPAPGLRISVEAKTGQSNYYRFGSVGRLSTHPDLNQIDTQWKRFAVHFDDLPSDQADQLRVGFDLMGPGTVHIADVRLYDAWMDDNDAKVMTQLLASADAMLLRPEMYERCRRLLQDYWAVFLDRYVPDESAAVQPTSRSAALPRTDQREVRSGSSRERSTGTRGPNRKPMFRRWRGWGNSP